MAEYCAHPAPQGWTSRPVVAEHHRHTRHEPGWGCGAGPTAESADAQARLELKREVGVLIRRARLLT
jgi:hypothetical protein